MPNERENILNTLTHRINSFADGYRQNIAIIGEPCIGKTSLIKNLLMSESIKKDSLAYLYLEIKMEPFEFCAQRFIKSVLSLLLKPDSTQDTVFAIENLARKFPRTAQLCIRVLQDIEKNKAEEAFSFMMDIPSALFEETRKRCVLILDEFHNIDNFALKNPFGILAKKIMIQKDTMYLFLSSRHTLAQRLLGEKLSLLFGNFEKIFLVPFDADASRAFLKDNTRAVSLPQAHLDFIASLAGNRPFYMRLICDEIERAVLARKLPGDDYNRLIEHACAETMFKKRGLINQHFAGLLSRISDEKLLSKSITVLLALSCENKKQQDIARSSRLQPRDASKILNRMIETDVITRNGVLYRFKDTLFHFWLHSVYLKKLASFSMDEEIEETEFRKDISDKLRAFVEEFEKECSLRIMELFRLFKNDVIQLNGKKHKFVSFSEVKKIEESSDKGTDILACGESQRWLCTIRNNRVTENDVSEIINKAKAEKRSSRINKGIIIAFSGINENAYLMAKEAKFWTWNIGELNVLMELYGKPHITR
ncbi:MAG: ATP-binding protein [Candidatus Omnitrophota bacterium]